MRLLGPGRLADLQECSDRAREAFGDQPLESQALRACLQESESFSGFDLWSRILAEPELPENLSVQVWMREAGLRGATQARNEAAELRALLRREP